MSDANLEPSDETVSLDLRIDRLCDRFEFLLLAGQRVTVTDFLRGEGLDPSAVAPELLRELERLAACYHPDQRPTVAVENVPAEDASDESAGVDVGTLLAGRYKFVEKIGGGGMGDVWMAQQTAPVRRQVAVKVIKGGMDTKAVLARFDAERQALAMMDHDNIARVYDAGSTPAGRPFFVMELVKGVPITKFCDARRLPPRERLRLFLSVCEAIQHAHQKGIIHRDIKPGNVLVALCDGKPVVKVIDFGIAKATGQALTDRTLVTGLGAVVGTPEYMSPEQATLNNLDIDTRSDVYSLGVLLYELLTGFTPVDRKSLGMAALLEMLRIVREVDAPRPSDKLSTADGLPGIAANRDTEPAKLVKLFRGELDWVLLKSLEKDRGRRYQSANAFAADVRNFLADEVVEARPPSRGYRLRKFVRRNRAAVWASVAVFVALLSGIVGTTLGLLEARKQAGEAEKAQKMEVEQRAVAERMFEDMLADYRASTDDAVLNLIGSRPTLGPAEKEFLTRALVRWQAFANRVGDDERSQAIRAEGDYQVGLLLGKLDQNAEALACLRRAAAVFLALSTANPDSDAYLLRTGLAHRGHATALFLSNEASQAKTVADAAVQTLTQFVSRVPRGVEGRHALALAINNRGMYHHISGRRSEAVADYRDAEHLLAALHREDPTNGIVADALAGAQYPSGDLTPCGVW